MKKALYLLAVLALAGAMNSQANAAERYVSGMAGISWMNDIDITDTRQSSVYKMTIATDGGFTAAGAVGCDYGSTLAELELGYQHNTVKSVSGYEGQDWGPYAAEGSVNVVSLMVNGSYDIPLGKGTELYAMAGVGGAEVTLKDFSYSESRKSTADQATLAWQVGAGMAIPLGNKVKLDLRYRYFATTDFEFDSAAMDPVSNNFSDNGRMHISSHSLMAGLRVGI